MTRAVRELSLATEFYPLNIVSRAVFDFRDHLTAEVRSSNARVWLNVAVRESEGAQELIVIREFLNYALDLALKERFTGAGVDEGRDQGS